MFRRATSFDKNSKQMLELHRELESHEIDPPAENACQPNDPRDKQLSAHQAHIFKQWIVVFEATCRPNTESVFYKSAQYWT